MLGRQLTDLWQSCLSCHIVKVQRVHFQRQIEERWKVIEYGQCIGFNGNEQETRLFFGGSDQKNKSKQNQMCHEIKELE